MRKVNYLSVRTSGKQLHCLGVYYALLFPSFLPISEVYGIGWPPVLSKFWDIGDSKQSEKRAEFYFYTHAYNSDWPTSYKMECIGPFNTTGNLESNCGFNYCNPIVDQHMPKCYSLECPKLFTKYTPTTRQNEYTVTAESMEKQLQGKNVPRQCESGSNLIETLIDFCRKKVLKNGGLPSKCGGSEVDQTTTPKNDFSLSVTVTQQPTAFVTVPHIVTSTLRAATTSAAGAHQEKQIQRDDHMILWISLTAASVVLAIIILILILLAKKNKFTTCFKKNNSNEDAVHYTEITTSRSQENVNTSYPVSSASVNEPVYAEVEFGENLNKEQASQSSDVGQTPNQEASPAIYAVVKKRSRNAGSTDNVILMDCSNE